MNSVRKYPHATAFRTSLEARLKNMARDEGVDLRRLRSQVAFDRLLCRLFHEANSPWALKGGYGMELRMRASRTTRDIDLAFRDSALLLDKGIDKNQVILNLLQKAVAIDLEDYFAFLIGEPMMDLDAAPYGGARYPVEARMDGRGFARFHLDVGVGDAIIEPLEDVRGRDWLEFAGVPAGSFPIISREQQLAEKFHAYTFQRKGAINSRIRDLIDMILLIRDRELDRNRIVIALKETFSRRKTHSLSVEIAEPPDSWKTPFEKMAKQCGIEESISECFGLLKSFMEDIRDAI